MGAKLDLTGKRFGRLLAVRLEKNTKNKSGQLSWLCECDCGGAKVVTGSTLVRGSTKSCGCLQRETAYNMSQAAVTHGSEPKRLYSIWCKLKGRVCCKTSPDYKDYGGRGIAIMFTCFEDFREWALKNGYTNSLSIDRIDNDGPYSRDNCRWATAKEQARNTRRNKWYTHPVTGERLSAIEWAERLGMTPGNVQIRLRRNWSLVDALSLPPLAQHYKRRQAL